MLKNSYLMPHIPRFSAFLRPVRRLRLLLGALTLSAFGHVSAFESLPPQYDGSMMPYDFEKCTPSEVPDSLQPFFINYVARHGARFLSSEKKVTRLTKAVDKARAAGTLTSLGEDVATLIDEVRRNTADRWGALDSVGCAEQQRLAAEMSAMWPSVTGSGVVQACATYVPRVVMSMYEFSHRLCSLNPDIQIYTGEGHQYDSLLRFFTTNPVYVSYLNDKPWKKEYDAFVSACVSAVPARAMFGDIFDEGELRRLTLDIYGVLQSLRAAGLPAPTTRWMTADDYRVCWQAANLEHYYARSENCFSREPAIAAIPLLRDIIDTTDKAVRNEASGEIPLKVAMHFGHAETLMPLLSLCDIEGCNAPNVTDASGVAAVWRDYDIVPLGANLEIVLLLAPSGTVYALTRLNGRDVRVGDFTGPIVLWTELRDYWIGRAAQMSL